MSDDAIETFIDIMLQCEAQGDALGDVSAILGIFIPKATKGYRIVSLLTTAVRWWEAVRVEYAIKWKVANDRDYFWGHAGRGAAASAWTTALLAEAAPRSADFGAIGTLGDLMKAYEQVCTERAWQSARRTGFPLRLAAWLTSLFTGPRWLYFANTTAPEPLWPSNGAPAGSRFADVWLRMVLIAPLDKFRVIQPSVVLSCYVDDLGTQVFGPRTNLARRSAEATADLVACVDKGAGLKFAGDKWVVTASSKAIAKQACNHAAKITSKDRMPVQLKVEQTMRNLGADFASGAKCQGRERRARVAKARKRCNRLEAIKLAGIQTERFHTVALLSVGSYAADVNGISNSALHQLRLVAARATAGKAVRRNLVLTLATAKNAKYDPAFRANTAPVRAWASAVWTGGQHTASLKAAYDASKGVLGWNAIEGPAGATLMTLKRIGWRHTAWNTWITDQDVQINLNRFCPKTVERLVVDATERACQREVAKQMGLPRLANGILLEPILQLIRKTHGTEEKPWGWAEAAYLRSTVVGGQWPQNRLHRAGLSARQHCLRCDSELGTLAHRHCRCSAFAAQRRAFFTGPALEAVEQGADGNAWWERCLLPHPGQFLPLPKQGTV